MKETNTYYNDSGEFKLPESLRVNPFAVPPEFFTHQEQSIKAQLNIEPAVATTSSYNVPEGYFDTLQNNILAKVAEQNLKSKVTMTGLTVPTNYFEEATAQIKTKIFEEKLRVLVPSDGFTVPDDFFEQAPEHIESQIGEQKFKAIVSQDGFLVPNAYFENLQKTILATIQTPVRTLPSRRNWLRYASAAAVAALISTGSYFAFYASPSAPIQSAQNVSLAEIPDEEIVNYLAEVSDGNDLFFLSEYLEIPEKVEIGTQVKDDDIEEYLNYML